MIIGSDGDLSCSQSSAKVLGMNGRVIPLSMWYQIPIVNMLVQIFDFSSRLAFLIFKTINSILRLLEMGLSVLQLHN